MRARPVVRQNDFAFGELSPDHAAAGDRDAVSRSLKKGRNIRLLNSYGFINRFGSRKILKLAGERILPQRPLIDDSGAQYIPVLRPDGMVVYTTAGSPVQDIAGLPFASLDELKQATFLSRVNALYIAHRKYPTQVFTRDPASGNWSLADYAFAVGPGGAPLQPYYRYAAKGITMQPSALTGSGIALAFSAPVLDTSSPSKHVGVIFRYGVSNGTGKEIRVTAVTDSTHATGTVLNALPPTKRVTVADSSGFVIGEEVKGLDTQATGFITNISGNDITVLMTRDFEGFDDSTVDTNDDGTPDSGEYLVGEFTRSYIAMGSQSGVSPAASVAWDEALISPVHGYPGCVFERSGRLGLTNFQDLPCGIAMSAPDAVDDFDIGAGGPADAIVVVLTEGGQRILRAVAAANLVFLTTEAAYYVPEGTDVPLSFQTFTAVKIGPVGIADDTSPSVVDEGVVYIGRGANRVMALLSTGSLTAPWRLVDVSSRSSHLISSPTSIAVTSGSSQAPERYVMALNSDGTVAVLFFDEAPARIGWVQWFTANGAHTSMMQIDGFLYTICNRTLQSGAATFLEVFDADMQMDCATDFTEPGAHFADLIGETLAVNKGTSYLGTYLVQNDGTIMGLAAGDYQAGYHFEMSASLWPPEPEGDARPSFALRHIPRISVRVEDTQTFQFGIATEGQATWFTVGVYLTGDDQGQPPPLRSDWFRASFGGWLKEPNVRIVRPVPQPVQVLSVAQEVPF